MCLVPDGIIIILRKKVSYIDNENIKIRTDNTGSYETMRPPKDAKNIKTRWLYENMDGSPDKRRKENPKRYDCQCGSIIIDTPITQVVLFVSDVGRVDESSALIVM